MGLDRDKLDSDELLLIKELFSAKTVSAYWLHSERKLSVTQIVHLLDEFSELKIVDVKTTENRDVTISLTEFGRSWLLERENWLIQGNKDQYWREIPKAFQQPTLEYDQNYELDNIDILEFFGD